MSAEHVLSWRVRDGPVLPAAHARRLDALARAGFGPGGPVLPPRAAMLAVGAAPGLRAGRVDDAGDMPAAGQHVPNVASHQPAGLVGPVPGHDVIVDRAHHV